MTTKLQLIPENQYQNCNLMISHSRWKSIHVHIDILNINFIEQTTRDSAWHPPPYASHSLIIMTLYLKVESTKNNY